MKELRIAIDKCIKCPVLDDNSYCNDPARSEPKYIGDTEIIDPSCLLDDIEIEEVST